MSLRAECSRFLLDGSNAKLLSSHLGDTLTGLRAAAGKATSDESRHTFESAAKTLASFQDTVTLGAKPKATPGEIRAAASLGADLGKPAPKSGETDALVKRLKSGAETVGSKGWNLSTVRGESYGTVGRDLLNFADLLRGLADDVATGKLGARLAPYWTSLYMDDRIGQSMARANAYLAGGKPAYEAAVAKSAATGRKFIY